MRLLYRMRATGDLQKELNTIEDIMFSRIFVYMDFILLSFIFSYMLYPLHQSIAYGLLTFIGFGLLCFSFYYSLGLWSEERLKQK
ncbi:hypothetical protein PZE06_19800 [Robertmurraya sp. DFI.2.37]|uniref:hypothetical protein n=1 Tax=Robertmurraya sp. DFI.2.37 TaxID=3031819 RepID=UPI0023DC44F5|nr:hypothetical protein [Robertmurraya sp. DFI.2.37]MDF1510381.1 hypothetical protein [Robertmurraya sp. DFI.2.37]